MVCKFSIPFTLVDDHGDTDDADKQVSDKQLLYELCECVYQKFLAFRRTPDSKLSISKTVFVNEIRQEASITYNFKIETKLFGV